jgi:hypothetical protein
MYRDAGGISGRKGTRSNAKIRASAASLGAIEPSAHGLLPATSNNLAMNPTKARLARRKS